MKIHKPLKFSFACNNCTYQAVITTCVSDNEHVISYSGIVLNAANPSSIIKWYLKLSDNNFGSYAKIEPRLELKFNDEDKYHQVGGALYTAMISGIDDRIADAILLGELSE